MRLIAFLAALLLAASAPAETPAPPKAAPVKWTVDDVIQNESASDFQYAPDGSSVVWVKTAPDAVKGEAVSQLVRTDLDSGRAIALTRGTESCTKPRWSP